MSVRASLALAALVTSACQVTTTSQGGQNVMSFGLPDPTPEPAPTATPAPSPAPSTPAAPPPVTASQPAAGQECTATLAVQPLQVRASCTVDARVTRQPGLLRYPCAGGPASVDFGGTRFQGAVQGGSVQVSIETRFRFTDGCQWSTKQEITGALSSGVLSYRYLEEPLPGQNGCARACDASATVTAR